jgi:hypothetical protein
LRSNEFHGAKEAGRITGGKQLLGIGAIAAGATGSFGAVRLTSAKSTVQGGGATLVAAGGTGGGPVGNVHGHKDSTSACWKRAAWSSCAGKGATTILSINTRSLDEVDGWIERMRCYWEERLGAMERLLRELKKDHKLGPKDRKRGSR